eukprot:3580460-Amphidinium_carterae.2
MVTSFPPTSKPCTRVVLRLCAVRARLMVPDCSSEHDVCMEADNGEYLTLAQIQALQLSLSPE